MHQAHQTALLIVGLLCFAAGVIDCHIVPTQQIFPTDSYGMTGLRVGHGCSDGEPTTAVRLNVPEHLLSVRPRQLADWNITIEERDLLVPTTLHGRNITKGVGTITWTGLLPEEFFQVFEISFKIRALDEIEDVLTEDELPNEKGMRMIFLPVVQICGDVEVAWTEVWSAGKEEPEYPAPILYIKEDNAADEDDLPVHGRRRRHL